MRQLMYQLVLSRRRERATGNGDHMFPVELSTSSYVGYDVSQIGIPLLFITQHRYMYCTMKSSKDFRSRPSLDSLLAMTIFKNSEQCRI